MQLLSRLLVVLFFGLFGGATLLSCYTSYKHERPYVARTHSADYTRRANDRIAAILRIYSRYPRSTAITIPRTGNDFAGCWILILFTLFGVALCIFSIYCLFTPKPIDPKFTSAPAAPSWVGLLVFAAAVAVMLLTFITALRDFIHGI